MAAKLPAEAMTVMAIGGASFLTSRTVNAASPPPMAINGASGPSTAPRLSVVSAARTIAGISRFLGGPPVTNPNAGEWPPFPGRYRMVAAVSRPQRSSHGTGHHAGVPPLKTSPGRSTNTKSWMASTNARKPYATAAIGTPRIAANSSAMRYALERMTTAGSTPPGDVEGDADWGCASATGCASLTSKVQPQNLRATVNQPIWPRPASCRGASPRVVPSHTMRGAASPPRS